MPKKNIRLDYGLSNMKRLGRYQKVVLKRIADESKPKLPENITRSGYSRQVSSLFKRGLIHSDQGVLRPSVKFWLS